MRDAMILRLLGGTEANQKNAEMGMIWSSTCRIMEGEGGGAEAAALVVAIVRRSVRDARNPRTLDIETRSGAGVGVQSDHPGTGTIADADACLPISVIRELFISGAVVFPSLVCDLLFLRLCS